MDSTPQQPNYLPAKVGTTPSMIKPGSSFTAAVTINPAAVSPVTVNLLWQASNPISPFNGATPSTLTVLAGATIGNSLPVSLKSSASGTITITAIIGPNSLAQTIPIVTMAG